ncbi:MAG: acyloxyacyl hydrolase [Verrucomicrobia bacterium]|nr:acyloxyacyl hydrolase [Verrucomicrobiota bacterium]
MKPRFLILCACASTALGWSVRAQNSPQALSREWWVGGGTIDVLDNTDRHWSAAVEYRFDPWRWNLRPWLGATYAEEQTYLLSAGLVFTWPTRSGLHFSVGWAPSYYHRGGGKNLGSDFEFYSFGEIGYTFKNRHSLNLRFGHVSNAGLKSYNPGTELLELGYSIPLGK